MKISELPKVLLIKALEYQKKETHTDFNKNSDNLNAAFNWTNTSEGSEYWAILYSSKNIGEAQERSDKLKGLYGMLEKDKQKDSIVESVRQQLLDRSNVGILKYGVTLDRTDLSLLDWLEHAKQESMDQVLYLEKAIQQLRNTDLDFPHRQS